MKNLIRTIDGAKFDPELRKWVLNVDRYETVMLELKRICEANRIHIEDIPTFAINLMRTKVPWAMGSLSYHGNVNCAFDYQHD